MAPLPDPPSPVVKVNINWGVEGDTLAQTIHYWQVSGSRTAADLSVMAMEVVATGDAHFAALCSDSVGMVSATVRDITSDMGAESTGGTPWVGTRGTALLPPSACAVVRHSIARHYRGGQPRTYLPVGVSGDVALTGLWADAFVTAVDSGWGAFADAISGNTFGAMDTGAIVNLSYYTGPNRVIISPTTGRSRNVSTRRAVPLIDTITGHTTAKNIGSQRRRNRDA